MWASVLAGVWLVRVVVVVCALPAAGVVGACVVACGSVVGAFVSVTVGFSPFVGWGEGVGGITVGGGGEGWGDLVDVGLEDFERERRERRAFERVTRITKGG